MAGQYFTSFDGAKIYYEKHPHDTNKWLIFLHGLGGDLNAWRKELLYFDNAGISTIAVDLRGHGFSARSTNKNFYQLENFAKDIATLLDKEAVKNSVIIGHCFGGMVSMYFQARFPRRSKGLVLVDTGYKAPFFSYSPVEKVLLKEVVELFLKFIPDLKIKGRRNFEAFVNTKDIDLKRIFSDILHTSLRSYLLISEKLMDMDIKQLLNKITVPSLIIEGSEDSIFPPDIAKYLHKRIKRSELNLIPNANHILVLNNPEDLEKSISSFLQKINFFPKQIT